jgi:hypothetical protein
MLVTTSLALLVAQASAAADLATSISVPSAAVYASGRYTVTISSVGSSNAGASTVRIQLPVTHTTPVAVMGTVGAKSSTCSQSGSVITCTVASLKRNRSTSVWFDMTLPENVGPLTFTATSVLSGDTNTNNISTATASLSNYAVSFTSGAVSNDHCTGVNLTSYFECTLFPSSIASFDADLAGDGTVSITEEPDCGGTWSQPTSDSLVITYTCGGDVAAEFEGYGVSASCWEGMTTFPSSTYMSMYRVCK